MPVHTNSVFNTTIGQFDQAFYTKITDMEEYLYDQSTLGEVVYKPFVQALNDAIVAWMGIDRTALVSDAIQTMYTSHTMSNLYGSPSSLVDSRTIATMDGFRTDVLFMPLDAWDDAIQDPNTLQYTAPTLEANTQTVQNAWLTEEPAWKALADNGSGSVGGIIMQLLFEDVSPSNPPLTKQQMGTIIYIDNHYKEVVQYLNANIPLPSYV